MNLGLTNGDAVDQAQAVLLGGEKRRAGAIGRRRGDHQGVGRADDAGLLATGIGRAVFLVEHIEGETHRIQGVAAPVLLGVLAGVGVLVSNPVGEGRIEGVELALGQVCGKVGPLAGRAGAGDGAVDQVDGVLGQVVHAVATALVGVGHGTAVLEAPLTSRTDCAIDAPRTRGRGGDDARLGGIEAGGNLHHHGDQAGAALVTGEGDGLGAGDLAFAQGVPAIDVDVGAVEGAVATGGLVGVHEGAVVVVDGVAA